MKNTEIRAELEAVLVETAKLKTVTTYAAKDRALALAILVDKILLLPE